MHLRRRKPVTLYCDADSPALAALCQAMEVADGDETLFLEMDSDERLEFRGADLVGIETAAADDGESTRNDLDELHRLVVEVSGMPEFSLLSETESPALDALRSALDANAEGAEDELMFLQTGETERVYFLRSSLRGIKIEPGPG